MPMILMRHQLYFIVPLMLILGLHLMVVLAEHAVVFVLVGVAVPAVQQKCNKHNNKQAYVD